MEEEGGYDAIKSAQLHARMLGLAASNEALLKEILVVHCRHAKKTLCQLAQENSLMNIIFKNEKE